MNQHSKNAIAKLIDDGIITASGDFEINEKVLLAMTKQYAISSKSNAGYIDMTRKFSGMSLLALKISRGIKPSEIKEGLIYLVTNKAWPEYTKIGSTTNLFKRLSTYQTSDPHRAYKLSGCHFVLDRRKIEHEVLCKHSLDIRQGEWVKNNKTSDILKLINSTIEYITDYNHHVDKHNTPIRVGDQIMFVQNKTISYGNVVSFTMRTVTVEGFSRHKQEFGLWSFPPESLVVFNGKLHKHYLGKFLKKIWNNPSYYN